MKKKDGRLPPIREDQEIIDRIEHQADRKQRKISQLLRFWILERLELEEELEKEDLEIKKRELELRKKNLSKKR